MKSREGILPETSRFSEKMRKSLVTKHFEVDSTREKKDKEIKKVRNRRTL